jgi:hypothetical protein
VYVSFRDALGNILFYKVAERHQALPSHGRVQRADLLKKGYVLQRTTDSSDITHLRIGPYPEAAAETVRKELAAQGYKTSVAAAVQTAPVDNAAAEANERMRRLEAEANAKLLGGTAPAASGDLEAQALARLGGAPPPSVPLNREAAAVAAMQTNTERAKIEAENRHEAELVAQQQAEADRLQRQMDQANAPPQQSTAAGILNALSGAISQATAQSQAQSQSQDSINQALQQQLGQIRETQRQVAARQAEQQQRAAAALAAQQAEQARAAQQARSAAQQSDSSTTTSRSNTASDQHFPQYDACVKRWTEAWAHYAFTTEQFELNLAKKCGASPYPKN